MFHKWLHYITLIWNDCQDKLIHWMNYHHEIKKFRNPRRVKIWSQIHLSAAQKQQIDDFFLKNYGTKVPHTWHRHYTAFTGNFDLNYIPEPLLIPEFEYFMNSNKAYNAVFADKNILPYLANSVGVVTPKILLSRTVGLFRNVDKEICSEREFEQQLGQIGEAFIKPTVDSCSGQGCAVINMQQGKDMRSGNTAEQIIDKLGDNFAVQERIKCHACLSKLYPYSANTLRIITYRWKNEILHMPISLRLGRGGKNVDNAHAGGMFIAVEDNGTLHSTAFSEFNQHYNMHPDTQVVFEKYQIPQVPFVLSTAKQMHALLPQVGVYSWDFTINEKGQPVLIEANTHGGSFWIPQMSHGKGLFGEKTAEVLRWLCEMKKLPAHKRESYLYGRLPQSCK